MAEGWQSSGGVVDCRVEVVAVDDVLLVEEFGGDVEEHVDAGDEVFVPAEVFGEPVAEDGRGGGEDGVVGRHQEHRFGDVRGAAEGEFPVQGEVPKDAQGQCDQIGGPIGPVEQFVQESEAADLDESRAGGEEHEFEETPSFSHGSSRFQYGKDRKFVLGFPRLFRNFDHTQHINT